MNDIEQKIYDDYLAGSKELLAKTKAAAEAVGLEYQKIIGPVEAGVKQGEAWVVKTAKAVWSWLLHWLDFLDDKRGKFSVKRAAIAVLLFMDVHQILNGAPGYHIAILTGAVVLITFWCAIEQK
jgi:hypothetical protein